MSYPGYPPPFGAQPPYPPPYPPVYPPVWGVPVDPVRLARDDLDTEQRRAGQAWFAVLGYAGIQIAMGVIGLLWEAHTHSRVVAFRLAFGRSPDIYEYNRLALTTRHELVTIPLELLQIPLVVLFLRWVHSAATSARRLGWPATRSPGMAVGGWFIPVVQLWFPYQSVRDMLAPGDPRRSVVARWWTVEIAAVVFGVIAGVVGFVSLRTSGGGSGVLYAIGVISLLLTAAWVVTFRPVLDAVTTSHTDALGRIVSGAQPVA